MKVSRIWLAAIGLIILVTTTLYMVGTEIVTPNLDAHLPYLAILVLAWVICVPSLWQLPANFARKGTHGETIRIITSRRTMVMLVVMLGIGLVPFDLMSKGTVNAIFGKLIGVGIALLLVSTMKQAQKLTESEDHG